MALPNRGVGRFEIARGSRRIEQRAGGAVGRKLCPNSRKSTRFEREPARARFVFGQRLRDEFFQAGGSKLDKRVVLDYLGLLLSKLSGGLVPIGKFLSSVGTILLARSGGSFMRSLSTFASPLSSVYRTVTSPVDAATVISVGCGNDGPFWMR